MTQVVDTLRPGRQLGPYRIESQLGEGGTGVVYRASRETDGTVVALKVLKEALAVDDVYRQRFAHEARAAAEVEHRHLVPIVDAGEAGGRPYLASLFVAGRSLAQRIQGEGPLPVDDVLRVAAEIGAALDALHEAGLVH